MRPDNFRLLIHHHHLAYVESDHGIWLSPTIGRWVEALAENFGMVGLLLSRSLEKQPQQDTRVDCENVRLYSFGQPVNAWRRDERLRRIRKVCSDAARESDGLLVRGITPRQYSVWGSTPVRHKAYLLVGSLSDPRRIDRWTVSGLYGTLMRRYRRFELKRIAIDGALLLGNSPELVRQTEQIYHKQGHFVPTNSFRKSEFVEFHVRPISEVWKILYCGRLDYHKGIQELFQAVAMLNQGGQICQLEIVGSKDEPEHTELEQLSRMLGISERVKWSGYVPYGPELFEHFQGSDALVLPSYMEGFPHAIWEAAANCCPVITSRVGGIPALWGDGIHGLLVPPRDVAAIVTALQRLFSDESLRANLVQHAYQHAQDYTVEACASRLADTLSEQWN